MNDSVINRAINTITFLDEKLKLRQKHYSSCVVNIDILVCPSDFFILVRITLLKREVRCSFLFGLWTSSFLFSESTNNFHVYLALLFTSRGSVVLMANQERIYRDGSSSIKLNQSVIGKTPGKQNNPKLNYTFFQKCDQ